MKIISSINWEAKSLTKHDDGRKQNHEEKKNPITPKKMLPQKKGKMR